MPRRSSSSSSSGSSSSDSSSESRSSRDSYRPKRSGSARRSRSPRDSRRPGQATSASSRVNEGRSGARGPRRTGVARRSPPRHRSPPRRRSPPRQRSPLAKRSSPYGRSHDRRSQPSQKSSGPSDSPRRHRSPVSSRDRKDDVKNGRNPEESNVLSRLSTSKPKRELSPARHRASPSCRQQQPSKLRVSRSRSRSAAKEKVAVNRRSPKKRVDEDDRSSSVNEQKPTDVVEGTRERMPQEAVQKKVEAVVSAGAPDEAASNGATAHVDERPVSPAAGRAEKSSRSSRSLNVGDIVEIVHKKAKSSGPIFEREEIQQRQGDAKAQRPAVASRIGRHITSERAPKSTAFSSHDERENFVVSRSANYETSTTTAKSLSERWKDVGGPGADRKVVQDDRRGHGVSRDSRGADVRRKRSRDRSRERNVTPSHKGDVVADKERHDRNNEPADHRPSIQERLGRIASGSASSTTTLMPARQDDLRHSLNRQASKRAAGRDGGRPDGHDRGIAEQSSTRTEAADSCREGYREGGSKQPVSTRSRSKTPDFSRRPDKGKYEGWMNDPLITPRGNKYFMHDDRDSYDNRRSFRGRGGINRSFGGGSADSGAWQHDKFEQLENDVTESSGCKTSEK